MEGRARAAKQAFDLSIAQAWHTAAFARTKKLKKLSDYLKATGAPAKAQTPAEMLEVFKSFQQRGAGMTIRRVN